MKWTVWNVNFQEWHEWVTVGAKTSRGQRGKRFLSTHSGVTVYPPHYTCWFLDATSLFTLCFWSYLRSCTSVVYLMKEETYVINLMEVILPSEVFSHAVSPEKASIYFPTDSECCVISLQLSPGTTLACIWLNNIRHMFPEFPAVWNTSGTKDEISSSVIDVRSCDKCTHGKNSNKNWWHYPWLK